MAAKRKRARRFVVGYKHALVVYGRLWALPTGHPDYCIADHCRPMCERGARRALKHLARDGIVYELVEKP